ncbi:MAG: hypothetical protein REI09_04060 [Candidatus Dactylopiibacterium sp.]|nr:hypothetical protein [Candidatus Dactylopiibacterium sp.]
MKPTPWPVLAALPLLMALTGCENDSAAYAIEGNKDHSITLTREQNVPFGDVSQRLVVANIPACQRRFGILASKAGMAEMKIHELPSGDFAANQGQTWYGITLDGCEAWMMPAPEAAEAAKGTLLGAFRQTGGKLAFSPAAK